MKTWIAVLGLAFGFSFSLHAEKNRPMSEMHGDCTNYKFDLQQEMSAWDKAAVPIAVDSAESLPLMSKISLSLLESKKVIYINPPEKTLPAKGKSFGGVFTFQPKQNGTLRIAAGSKLWFDLVDKAASKTVPSAEFEMQTKCPKILKVATFPVEAGKVYAVQVSGSSTPKADFILSIQ